MPSVTLLLENVTLSDKYPRGHVQYLNVGITSLHLIRCPELEHVMQENTVHWAPDASRSPRYITFAQIFCAKLALSRVCYSVTAKLLRSSNCERVVRPLSSSRLVCTKCSNWKRNSMHLRVNRSTAPPAPPLGQESAYGNGCTNSSS